MESKYARALFLGFMILIGTPILGVASSTITYGLDLEWIYVTITGMVLIVQLIGLF